MSLFLFPDNTVLCNFAAVSRLPLLKEVLRDRGRWVEAVAAEAHQSGRYYPELLKIPSEAWLRDPIEIEDENEIAHVEQIRRSALGGSVAEPLKHLGEAQTCHIILTRVEFNTSFWITDDRDAGEYAQFQTITTRDTMDLISEAVADGCCTRNEGFHLLHLMRQQGRHLRIPNTPADL